MKNQIKRLFVLKTYLTFFCCVGGMPAQAVEMKLEEWIQLSWQHSPEISQATAKVTYAEASKLLSQAGYFPTLSAKYQFREFEQSKQNKVLSLNAEVNVFRGFGDFYGQRASSHLLDAEKKAFEAKKLSVARNLSDTLLEIATTSAEKIIYDENSLILDRRMKEYKRRTKIGRSRDVDLIQNQIDRLQLERKKANNQRALHSAFSKLQEYAGKLLTQSPFELKGLLEELVAYHSKMEKVSYGQAELQERRQASDLAVSGARSGLWPTVKGVASYYPNNNSRYSQYGDDWSVGIDLEWKFFEGFATKAAMNQARALQLQADSKLALYQLDETQNQDRLSAEWAQLTAERRLIVDAEALAVKEFQAQERDFKLGLATVLELSTSDEQYLNLKLEHLVIDQRLGKVVSEAIERGGMAGLNL